MKRWKDFGSVLSKINSKSVVHGNYCEEEPQIWEGIFPSLWPPERSTQSLTEEGLSGSKGFRIWVWGCLSSCASSAQSKEGRTSPDSSQIYSAGNARPHHHSANCWVSLSWAGATCFENRYTVYFRHAIHGCFIMHAKLNSYSSQLVQGKV